MSIQNKIEKKGVWMFKMKIKMVLTLLSVLILTTGITLFGVGVYNDSTSLNFGSTNDPIPKKRLKEECCRHINTQGLSDLKAYGSGMIYYLDFKPYWAEKEKSGEIKKLYVVNLLNDEIYYYKDRPLRWYGMYFKKKRLGDYLFTHKPYKAIHAGLIRLIYGTPPVHDASQLQTEREIVQDLGGIYYAPLKDDDNWLGNPKFIEDMIQLFESIPIDAHLYAHCVHGRGRTTSYLVFYDIFRNSKKVSLKDIANRHYCLGREDVLNTELWSKGTWTQAALDARKNLVENFYAYMTDSHGYGYQSWIMWVAEKKVQLPKISVHRRDEHGNKTPVDAALAE